MDKVDKKDTKVSHNIRLIEQLVLQSRMQREQPDDAQMTISQKCRIG